MGITIKDALQFGNGVDVSLAAGNNNDWNPSGLSTETVLRITSAGASPVITGISAPSSPRLLILLNITGAAISYAKDDANSVAANRIRFNATSPVSFPTGHADLLFYSTSQSRWYVVGF